MNDGNKKLYEVSFLTKSENGAAVVVSHLTGSGGEILEEGTIKKINLSYPIKKEKSAHFGFTTCRLPAGAVAKVNDAVKLDSEILRILVLEVEEPSKKEEQKSSRPASVGPDSAIQRPARREKIADEGIVPNELLEEKLEEILQ